ncbi:MAG: ATP-binding protein [Nitrospirales bacterium]
MMETSCALQLLESSSPHQRLRGARHFSRTNLPDLIPKFKTYLQKERVSHVRAALELAIKRNSSSGTLEPQVGLEEEQGEYDGQPVVSKQNADKWAGILLHEIEPKVGLIRVSAQKEISNFSNSETKNYLESLDRILAGFSDLRRSIATPKADEFDLAELVQEVSQQERTEDSNISLSGQKPFLIKSDKNLLHMAISNGIRNAIEAIQENTGEKNIVVSWAKTDVDYSLTILDNGLGIQDGKTSLFEVGNTSKKNHGGFGLAIIKHALENLDGRASLSTAKDGGAKLELRWRL